MNYGYVFFKEQNNADKFMKENAGSALTEITAIDVVSMTPFDENGKNE